MKSYASVPAVKAKLGKSVNTEQCSMYTKTNTQYSKLFLKKQKPPLPSVNRVDSLNSSGIQPAVISDLKSSATCDQEHTCKGL